MRKALLKSLITIVFLIIIFVAIARILGKSETVSDYKAKRQNTSEMENSKIDSSATDSDIFSQNGENDSKDGDESTFATGNDGAVDNPKQNGDIEQNGSEDDNLEGEIVEDAFYIEEISEELKDIMNGKSYAEGIDETIVNYDMLRHVVIMYNNFEGEAVKGEIVCNEAIAQDLLEIFEELYNAGYQLEEVALVDKYDADDNASMEHNNTSCFNYRVVENTTHLSNHSYGRAIDLNPFYNPYVTYRKDGTEHISPVGSEKYADRTLDFPYKIDENDLAYKLFMQHGFTWGGHWNSSKDYQHFEKNRLKSNNRQSVIAIGVKYGINS